MKLFLIPSVSLLLLLCAAGCRHTQDNSTSDSDVNSDSGGDPDSDSDGDVDSDSSGDPDSDSDGDVDSDSDEPGDTDSDSNTETASETDTDYSAAGLLFNPSSIATIDIILDSDDMTSLSMAPDAYVTADVKFTTADGMETSLSDSGVRLKGKWGSARTLDQKAAFLLNFDRFVANQRLFGVEKLAVNNMVQDASMIHETVGYRLFREMDVPAPRTGYARVRVNGELYGLYTLVESADNEPFLKNWFGQDSGNLYEGEYGVDLEPDLIASFDQDNGDDESKQDLFVLVEALQELTEPAEIFAGLKALFDMDSYVRFAATEIFLGHWDGYAWTRNNYFIYHRPEDGKFVFIPWGIDQTFADYLTPFDGDGSVQTLCLSAPACRHALGEAFREVVDTVNRLALAEYAASLESVVYSAALADPRKEYSDEDVYNGIAATRAFLTERGNWLLDNMGCEDPAALDQDNDGSSGCGEDCDDLNPAVFPGAEEACNFRDDDCDGVMDNNPICPSCLSQPAASGGTLSYCFVELTFDEARLDCQEQGGDLVSISDAARQAEVSDQALAIRFSSWWIGLTDIAQEGTFTWLDGTPLVYEAWIEGEPNNAGENENCGHLGEWNDGMWNDIPCDLALPYICYIP